MRIDDNKLKIIYQAYIESKKPFSRRDCPSPKKLMNLLRSKSSEKQAKKIIDHISSCNDCARKFKFLLQGLRDKNTLIQNIGQLHFSKKSNNDQQNDTQGIIGSEIENQPFFTRFSRGSAFILAGFVVVVIIVSMLVILRTPEKYRTESLLKVKLLQPVDEKISKSSLVFKWKEIRNAEYYTLKLFDEILLPIWESENILNNYIVLPKEAVKKLEAGSSYFWMITAHITNRENIMSALEEFTVKK
jgi:hypothetical protein